MDFFDILKMTDLFKNLKRNEIFDLLENTKVHHFKPNEIILKSGEIDQNIKIIMNGRVYLHRLNGERVELGTGSYFGELNLLNESNVKVDVFALSEVEILIISKNAIEECYKKDHRVYGVLMENLAKVLAKRLSSSN